MRTIITIAVVALAASTLGAQDDRGGRRRGGQFNRAAFAGPVLAVAADTDSSGDVSAAEWTGFFAGLKTDKEGMVDKAALARSVFVKLLDRDADAKLEKSDLEKIHQELDKNSDGVLQSEEAFGRGRGDRGGRRRRGGGGEGDGGFRTQDDEPAEKKPAGDAEKKEEPKPTFAARYQRTAISSVVRLADADSNREITVDEWKSFLGSLKESKGQLSDEQVQALMAGPQREARPEGEEEEGGMRRGRNRGGRRGGFGIDRMIEMAVGEEAKKADIEKVFSELDKNGDKALQADELEQQRRRRRQPV